MESIAILSRVPDRIWAYQQFVLRMVIQTPRSPVIPRSIIAVRFTGLINTDESTNGSDSSGVAVYSTISDWLLFENSLRHWGKNGTAFPDPVSQGRCVSGESCRIWDWSLRTTDSLLKDALVFPTDGAFYTIYGKVLTDNSTSPISILRNAIELIGDDLGNENGLCESNETCIFTPNIGVYQGHGEIVSTSTTISSGPFSGIVMLKYETNCRS